MKITRAVVPSLFTVLNIFCGFRSIIHASQAEFTLAAWFIILAAIFDVLDGLMARITKSSSDFGVELDSLSDVVSFGAAPAFLLYAIHFHTQDGLGMLISAMPMVFGAMRLARFNAQLVSYDKDYFKGLPIPASALTICAFILANSHVSGLYGFAVSVVMPLVVTVSLLMVSTFKYDTFPRLSRRGIRQHPLRFTVGIVALTAIILTRGDALLPFLLFYIATGPLRFAVHHIQSSLRQAEKQADDKEVEITSVDV